MEHILPMIVHQSNNNNSIDDNLLLKHQQRTRLGCKINNDHGIKMSFYFFTLELITLNDIVISSAVKLKLCKLDCYLNGKYFTKILVPSLY